MKNHLRSAYCNQCGTRQKDERPVKDEDGRTKLYADIAHPINSGCRDMIQRRVIHEYENELKRAKMPGYVSRYDDIDGDGPAPSNRPVVASGGTSHDSSSGHRSPSHVSTTHSLAAHSPAAPGSAPPSPAAHAPKPPSASAAPLDQPRIQSAEDPRFGLHRSTSRSATSAGPRTDGFGAGIFES
jgi:stage V sporulation protein G